MCATFSPKPAIWSSGRSNNHAKSTPRQSDRRHHGCELCPPALDIAGSKLSCATAPRGDCQHPRNIRTVNTTQRSPESSGKIARQCRFPPCPARAASPRSELRAKGQLHRQPVELTAGSASSGKNGSRWLVTLPRRERFARRFRFRVLCRRSDGWEKTGHPYPRLLSGAGRAAAG